MEDQEPPRTFPEHLAAAFTFGGRVTVRSYHSDGHVFNQRYLGGSAETSIWTRELVEDWRVQCERGQLHG